ncbi:hypothetical protein ICJ04_08570 [Stenotrophomonas sp. 169]|uniref:hypothetical protein n=1 Tax=Stenotrophomonas sp. 169 TaxID=2770322 RepID=UPI0016625523|nr:hypothetical protein [Stenotrophomonas sp. 169]QNR98904.1 hypothetical protein ICJ04_08570 [Stenotrophomonas sp. 169]
MFPLPPVSVVLLLEQFADLAMVEQSTFLDTLNIYLYTSPQQRRRMREAWRETAEVLPVTEDPDAVR